MGQVRPRFKMGRPDERAREPCAGREPRNQGFTPRFTAVNVNPDNSLRGWREPCEPFLRGTTWPGVFARSPPAGSTSCGCRPGSPLRLATCSYVFIYDTDEAFSAVRAVAPGNSDPS